MELRSLIRSLIAVLGLGAVLTLLYRLLSQNKRLTNEDEPSSPAPADGTDIGSVVAAKKKCAKTAFRREVKEGKTGTVTEISVSHIAVTFGEEELPPPLPGLQSPAMDI